MGQEILYCPICQSQLRSSDFEKGKAYPIAHTLDTATIGAGNESRVPPLKYFAGDIAEILIFTRAISETERDAIERYLRGKYGI